MPNTKARADSGRAERGGSQPLGVCRKEKKRARSSLAWDAVVGLCTFPRVLNLKEEASLSSRGNRAGGGDSCRSHAVFLTLP